MIAFVNRTVVQPLVARKEGSPYLSHYRGLRRTQFDPRRRCVPANWRRSRTRPPRLRDRPLLPPALAEAGLRPDDLRSPDDLPPLPVLTKADLRTHRAALPRRPSATGRLQGRRRPASTGVPAEVFVDDEPPCSGSGPAPCGPTSGAAGGSASGWPSSGATPSTARRPARPAAQRPRGPGRLPRHARTRRRTTARVRGHAPPAPPSLIFGHAHSVYLFAGYVKKAGVTGRAAARRRLGGDGAARLAAGRDRGGVRLAGHQPLRLRGSQPDRLRVRAAPRAARQRRRRVRRVVHGRRDGRAGAGPSSSPT